MIILFTMSAFTFLYIKLSGYIFMIIRLITFCPKSRKCGESLISILLIYVINIDQSILDKSNKKIMDHSNKIKSKIWICFDSVYSLSLPMVWT